jgi:hypothetical protein
MNSLPRKVSEQMENSRIRGKEGETLSHKQFRSGWNGCLDAFIPQVKNLERSSHALPAQVDDSRGDSAKLSEQMQIQVDILDILIADHKKEHPDDDISNAEKFRDATKQWIPHVKALEAPPQTEDKLMAGLRKAVEAKRVEHQRDVADIYESQGISPELKDDYADWHLRWIASCEWFLKLITATAEKGEPE